MSNDLSLMEIVGYQVESSVEWRREKAEQFPRDSHRNLRAAEGAFSGFQEGLADAAGTAADLLGVSVEPTVASDLG